MNFNYSIRYSLIIFPKIEKLLILRNEIKLNFYYAQNKCALYLYIHSFQIPR